MSTTPAAAEQYDRPEPELEHQLAGESGTPEPNRSDAVRVVALGVLMFVSGAFLLAMFVSLATGGSASPWGPINDLLSAAGNVLLAVLVPRLSSAAARTRGARCFVRLIVGASLLAAASSVLLVAGVLPFERSTVISMVAIVLQCGWMAWLNTAWSRNPRFPRAIWRLGAGVGYGLLTGLGLVGASFLLPWGSVAANALLVPGVALGGVIWLVWPLWFVLLGRQLLHSAGAEPSAADPTDA
ncbi:MAG: hypothetical protein IPL41_02660 [Micropruina sp.]|nr:hypothetical protein [Micropruina sp.]